MWVDDLLRKLSRRVVATVGAFVFLSCLLVLGARDTANGTCSGVIPDLFHSAERPERWSLEPLDSRDLGTVLAQDHRAICAQHGRDQLPGLLLEAAAIGAASMAMLAGVTRLARNPGRAASANSRLVSDVLQLEGMHDRGSLSDAEFAAAKHSLLAAPVEGCGP